MKKLSDLLVEYLENIFQQEYVPDKHLLCQLKSHYSCNRKMCTFIFVFNPEAEAATRE